MRARVLSTLIGINSCLWFVSVGFLTYAFGMLIITLDWKQFLLAVAIFVSVSLSELVITAIAH